MRFLFFFLTLALPLGAQEHWPQFRGPLGTGVAPNADPPVEWDEETNIAWKTELPGLGHSSPIVWEDRIFLTTAIPFGEKLAEPKYSGRPGAHNNLPISQKHRFEVLAVDANSGKILWQTPVATKLPHEGGHESGSLASASVVTDGEHVWAFFGSYGLFCLTSEGKLVWEKDLGDQFTKHGHGEGSSPALSGDYLAVNWDHEEQSFVVVFEKKTGDEVWRKERDEGTSWTSPIVIEHEGKPQLVVSGTTAVRGYDLETGDVIWHCSGLSDNVVATPVWEQGFVYAGSSYVKKAMLGIKLDGAMGDITGTENVIWKRTARTPYVPSPLLVDGYLYFLSHYQGVLSRVEGKTGDEPTGPFRLPGLREVYASPVAADDRIYLLDRSGVTMVISTDPTPKPLGVNVLDDRFSATPAIVGDTIYLRGEQFLYAIREKQS
ncbi:MAG: PQQ-binding-like beta-propeller repeat protein [Verrucomicrobiales bacterium]|nr:PQQ-binding-like beta-propeller repeat protein [Verrucomicrobiales bacterium]